MSTGKILLALAMGLGLSGCNQYWERKDTVLVSSGDAVASNAAVQISDPWPAGSRNTTIPSNGARLQRVMQRYQSNATPATVPGPGTAGAQAGGGGTSLTPQP
ncbi:MAG: hypothetical protein U1E62_08180 [Alsobacter sp.]